jgi:formylglycine-generating enzyme
MTKTYLTASMLLCLFAACAFPLVREELSPQAQEIVTNAGIATIVMNDGSTIKAFIDNDTGEKLNVKMIKDGARIPIPKTLLKKNIKSVTMDVAPLLAEKLMALGADKDKDKVYTAEEYKKYIAVMDEFIVKCKDHPAIDDVKKLRGDFDFALQHINKGMERIEGEWLPPVSASVKRFSVYSKKLDDMKLLPAFTTNKTMQATYEDLLDKRRAVARGLPEMMEKRLPGWLQTKNFDEAVHETAAFLHFWVDLVLVSERRSSAMVGLDVFLQMDFDYILRMEDQIMDAYRKAGLGAGKQPAGVSVPTNMIFIPGGYFLMGNKSAAPKDNDFPMHIVYVSPFLIDKHEVSNEEYKKFADEMKRAPRSNIEHPDSPPLKQHEAAGWKDAPLSGDRQPVVGVDWFDAYAYANWVGKRLPTEAEWERAARGSDDRKFPWAGDKDPGQCSVNCPAGRACIAREMDTQNPPKAPTRKSDFGCSCVKAADEPPPPPTVLPEVTWDVDKTLPQQAQDAVDSKNFEWDKDFNSPYGVVDMAGNAAEWVFDVYDAQYYRVSPIQNPKGPDSGDSRVFRGGSYLSDSAQLTTYWRGFCAPAKRDAGYLRPAVGFRCAKSLDLVDTMKPEEPVKSKTDEPPKPKP